MRCFAKNLSYVLVGSLPYFLGCGQKPSSPQPTPVVSVVEKSLEELVSPETTPNKVPEEQPVFKKEISGDCSYLSISGYNASQREDVSFRYDLVYNSVKLSVRMVDGVQMCVSASMSYLDSVFSVGKINDYSLTTSTGESISFNNDAIVSPAKGNINLTEADVARAKYVAYEKLVCYLNLFERDIMGAHDEAHARYTTASQQFKEFLSK